MKRYPLAIWIGIVFSLTLAAGALYWDSSRVVLGPASTWATIAQVNAEYRAAARQMALPAGHDWPAATPFAATASDGTGNAYAAGLGREWAEWYWFDTCATVAVSSAESTPVRLAVIGRLPEFYSTSAFATSADPEYYRRAIDAARKGDLAALREYVESIESARENGD